MKNHLREYRKAAGMTQADLADKVGVVHFGISRYELGQRIPRVDIAMQIARALGCTVYDIWPMEETGTD